MRTPMDWMRSPITWIMAARMFTFSIMWDTFDWFSSSANSKLSSWFVEEEDSSSSWSCLGGILFEGTWSRNFVGGFSIKWSWSLWEWPLWSWLWSLWDFLCSSYSCPWSWSCLCPAWECPWECPPWEWSPCSNFPIIRLKTSPIPAVIIITSPLTSVGYINLIRAS